MISESLYSKSRTKIIERSRHLDGIRGIAALAVAIFHFARSFDNSLLSSEKIINSTFISSLWNGHFAVAVFFVLSGFLFLNKSYNSSLRPALKAIIKRYLRLSLPILAICLLAYTAHVLGLYFNGDASILSNSDWLKRWYSFNPSISLAISESLWGDFVSFNALKTYNANLWTISYELLAVSLVIAFGVLCKTLKPRMQAISILIIFAATYGTHYFEFFLGAALALPYIQHRAAIPTKYSILLILLALSIAPMVPQRELAGLAVDLSYPIAAAILIFAVSSNKNLRMAFSCKPLLKLGEVSFGVYLTHFIILNSIASYIFLLTESKLATFTIYAATTAIASIIFTKAIDKPLTIFLNKLFLPKKVTTTIPVS